MQSPRAGLRTLLRRRLPTALLALAASSSVHAASPNIPAPDRDELRLCKPAAALVRAHQEAAPKASGNQDDFDVQRYDLFLVPDFDNSSLSGQVNLAAVKSLTLGVGDGTAGSSGLIFVDDVTLFRAD